MLHVDNTALILIDIQGKLAQIVDDSDLLQNNVIRLIKGLQVLDLPIIWLEQYPDGLGPTTDSISQLLKDENEPIEKMRFSVCESPQFKDKLSKLDVNNFIVAGIEAHICVYQTVRELLAKDYHVEFVQDAISSRTEMNKKIAISKMTALGALPTSVEMLLFELMETAEHPKFREISRIIK